VGGGSVAQTSASANQESTGATDPLHTEAGGYKGSARGAPPQSAESGGPYQAMTGGGPAHAYRETQQQEPLHTPLTWLNIRGLRSKDELLVRKAEEQQWPLVLLTETKLKREQEQLYSGEQNEWSWLLGSGQGLSQGRSPGKGGVGALIHSSIRGAVQKLDSTREQLWLRLESAQQHRPLFIGVVYLPSGTHPTARAECARIYEELAARVQKYQCQGTVILGGDMNARLAANGDQISNAAGEQLKVFSQRHGLLIANTQLEPRGSTDRCRGAFSRMELRTGGLQKSTVDYVLVSKADQAHVHSLTLVGAVPHRVLSDHKPLVLQWQWQAPASAQLQLDTRPRVRWRVEDLRQDRRVRQRLQAEMSTAMGQWTREARTWIQSEHYRSVSSDDKVTALLASWEYQLTRTLASTVGAKLVQQRSKSWMTGGNLLELIRERNKLRQQCEDTDKGETDTLGAEWQLLSAQALLAQKAVRKEIHRRKRLERGQTYTSIEQEWSDPKLFFHRVQQMRDGGHKGTSPPILRRQDGTSVSDLSARLDLTRQHYAKLGTDERSEHTTAATPQLPSTPLAKHATLAVDECIEPEPEFEFDDRFAQSMEFRVEQMATDSLTQVPTPLDQPWTKDEFTAALAKLRNGKAPGPDVIHAEFLRYGGPALHTALRVLFNEIWQLEVWPERWGLGLICPIYKRAGDEADLDNYRPITLLSIVSKLFEILLNTRLMGWAEQNRVLCDEQGGFRSKRGCADQLFLLKEVWSSRREQKLPTYAAFLDVKSAYDRVWRTGLWHQLYECGVRGKTWRMIRAMYARMQRVALVDGQRSAPFPVQVGVSQGSVLSPFLYSVFIDGLIRRLRSDPTLGVRIAGEQLTCLLYADDIVLLASDPAMLQRMLAISTEYAQQWRFHFNGRKSQVVVQGTGRQVTDAQQQVWLLDGHELQVVPEYKYLGLECGFPPGRGSHRSFCARLRQATTHRAHDLLLSGCEMNELDARCVTRLWSSLCRPILEYGAEVWRPNQGQSKQLEQVQGWFARRVLGCSPSTPAVFATSELGLRSLEARRQQYQLRYWRRLCAALPERLLHRVFRHRVRDVKAHPLLTQHSLCHQLHATLCTYQFEDEWELLATDQLYAADEWNDMTATRVSEHEATGRQVTLASKSTLDCYQCALVPSLGVMAPYLQHSRNREGAWIRCRLRSDTLPVMQVLARHCRPRRSDAQALCGLCPPGAAAGQGEVESAMHLLTSCQAPGLRQLRLELCTRLQLVLQQWQQEKRAALAQDWSGLPPAAAASAVSVRAARAEADSGFLALSATVAWMQAQLELVQGQAQAPLAQSAPPCSAEVVSCKTAAAPCLVRVAADDAEQWFELLLGRRADAVTGRSWCPSLLLATQSPIHNYLLLAWRCRATLLGGVPTLQSAGRGLVTVPYKRMKSIGVRPT
jgi:endonuclease/exonuclease/phosphatase family metal-dependent hydrolase